MIQTAAAWELLFKAQDFKDIWEPEDTDMYFKNIYLYL